MHRVGSTYATLKTESRQRSDKQLHKNASAECISSHLLHRTYPGWRFTRVGESINPHYEELVASHARCIDKSRAQCVTWQFEEEQDLLAHLPGVPRNTISLRTLLIFYFAIFTTSIYI